MTHIVAPANRASPLTRLTAAGFLIVWTSLFLWPAAPPAGAQGTEADVLIAQAVLAYEDKHYDKALSLLRDALAIDPNNVEILYYIGLVQIATRNFGPAIEVLEEALAKSPTDLAIKFQLGVAYFSLEQYDKAEPLLTEVFKVQPKKENVGYYVGFMRYRRKDYQGALEAFRAGASPDPSIQQLTKFYSGLTLGILGLPEQGASELEEASRIRTTSPLTGPADRLRDTMVAARDQQGRLHGEVRFGAFYDTNVRTNPPPTSDPTANAIRSTKTNSPGQLAAVRFEYAWLRKGPWESTATYSFFQTWVNDIPIFNVQNHLGQLAGSYRGLVKQMPFQLSALYSYDITDLGGLQFLSRHSGAISGTLVESPRYMTILQGRVQVKDFSSRFLLASGLIPEEQRSGTNWMGGINHVFRFAEDKHLIRIGYQYDIDDTVGQDWFYRGNRFLVGGQYTLPWRSIRLSYDFDLHLRQYANVNAIFPVGNPNTVKQHVVEQNHVVRAEYPLPHNFTLVADFQANISRANLFEVFYYDRYIGTLSMSWSF